MPDLIERIKAHSLPRFLAVGVLNTLLGAVVMFVLYDAAHFSYWASSAVSYGAGGILSFALNRRFTFRSKAPLLPAALKFALTLAVCYLLAYGTAKPLVLAVFSAALGDRWAERIAMLVGMAFYTVLNYFGQRFFAFAAGRMQKAAGRAVKK